MYHLTARARPGTRLFDTWTEARALWDRILERCPEISVLLLMINHLHADGESDKTKGLSDAMRAYANWRNATRRESGVVWEGPPTVTPIAGRPHRQRTRRYIYLNPCRAGLVTDPLAWPFSTYRDELGLAVPPVRPRTGDAWALHRYVSSDPSVSLEGTELPRESVRLPTLEQVEAAVSQLTRTTADGLRCRGRPRRLLLRACRALTGRPVDEIATFVGVGRTTVWRAGDAHDPEVRLVARVVGDPRFPLLHDGSLSADRRLEGPRR